MGSSLTITTHLKLFVVVVRAVVKVVNVIFVGVPYIGTCSVEGLVVLMVLVVLCCWCWRWLVINGDGGVVVLVVTAVVSVAVLIS